MSAENELKVYVMKDGTIRMIISSAGDQDPGCWYGGGSNKSLEVFSPEEAVKVLTSEDCPWTEYGTRIVDGIHYMRYVLVVSHEGPNNGNLKKDDNTPHWRVTIEDADNPCGDKISEIYFDGRAHTYSGESISIGEGLDLPSAMNLAMSQKTHQPGKLVDFIVSHFYEEEDDQYY